MSSAANILNNTILIPTDGSLRDLPASTVAEDLGKNTKVTWSVASNMSVFIKDTDGSSKKMITIQSLTGFGMRRENEKQSAGGNQDYVINLPGKITYSDVMIKHLFSRDTFFLDWIKNGITLGGISRADFEIHINAFNTSGGKMVFTLCDAFPIKWALTRQLGTTGESQLLFEEVTVTYSKAVFGLNYGIKK